MHKLSIDFLMHAIIHCEKQGPLWPIKYMHGHTLLDAGLC